MATTTDTRGPGWAVTIPHPKGEDYEPVVMIERDSERGYRVWTAFYESGGEIGTYIDTNVEDAAAEAFEDML